MGRVELFCACASPKLGATCRGFGRQKQASRIKPQRRHGSINVFSGVISAQYRFQFFQRGATRYCERDNSSREEPAIKGSRSAERADEQSARGCLLPRPGAELVPLRPRKVRSEYNQGQSFDHTLARISSL